MQLKFYRRSNSEGEVRISNEMIIKSEIKADIF